MELIANGDRVQIVCSTRLDDGTTVESPDKEQAPYWVRIGAKLAALSEGLVGSRVGDRRTVRVEAGAGRAMTMEVAVLAIRKAAV